jgi:amidase
MDEELLTAPAVRLAEAIRSKHVSSRELLDGYLGRIDRLGRPINAVVTLDIDRAQSAAAAADDATTRGELKGPLHGLPVTIKDAIETAGIRSTGGAVELSEHVPAADAPAVAKLKAAGTIVFGKTNLPRWSGNLQTYNDLFGTTNNPWATDRTPGGSSGGAAAAVACGFTSFELGTDIGGSIRAPSHFCGVFGLKPSYGVVPQRGYLDHVGGGMTDVDINVFGPIARSADDLDLLLTVLAGPEPERAPAWRLELPGPGRRSLADYRIGTWLDDPSCAVDREYLELMRRTADGLSDAGAKVDESHPDVTFGEQIEAFMGLIVPAVSPSLADDVADASSGSHRAWLRHNEDRARLRQIWASWFEDHDILLCPVVAMPCFPHDQEGDILSRTVEVNGVPRSHIELIQWAGLIGVVGLPSAVPPIGRTSAGLPVGVQVVAPYLFDRRAVQVARLIAGATGGYSVPPGF